MKLRKLKPTLIKFFTKVIIVVGVWVIVLLPIIYCLLRYFLVARQLWEVLALNVALK